MSSLRSISILITAIITFLLIISIVTYKSLNDFISDARWVNHASLVLKELEAVTSAVKDAQTSHRGYELTADSSYLVPYLSTRSTVLEKVEDIDSLLLGYEVQQQRLDTLNQLISKQFRITDEILTRRKEGGGLDRYGVNLIKFDEENMNKIRGLADRMAAEEEALLKIRTTERNRASEVTPLFILVSFVAAVIALSYLFIQLYRTIKVKNSTEYELEQNLKLLSEEVNNKELAQESLQKVLDGSTNGILFLRAVRENGKICDFQYMLSNKQIENVIGYSPDEVKGKNLLDLFPGAAKTGIFESYVNVVEKGESLNGEFFYDHENLNAWFHVTARKLEDGCVVTFSDITDRKQYEQDLLVKNEELEESNKNLEQFAYVASHDLQEPLRKIRTFGDRVVTKFSEALDDKGKDYINRMNGAAERMQSLIDDLLKYSRVARNPKSMEKVDLKTVIDNLMIDLETLIKERGVQFEVKGLRSIDGDVTQLRQLFQNLISNAVKFTPPERQPLIKILGKRVRGASQKDFKVGSNKYYLRIEVTDNGIGFDQKYAERIFHIFERLHGRSEFKGTGIGLAICQKVVQNHNGYIRAESSTDGGAKFIILLPIKNELK